MISLKKKYFSFYSSVSLTLKYYFCLFHFHFSQGDKSFILHTHSALLNLFSNFPTSPVWGWHTPYFPGNSASNSLNLKVEERGVNETQPLPHTPFPFLIITSTSQILHKLLYWSYTINEDLDQISKHFYNYNYVFKYFWKG